MIQKREKTAQQITKINEDTIKIEKKNQDCLKDFELQKENILNLMKEKEKTSKNISNIENDINITNERLIAINQDIKQTETQIQEIEKKMAEAKLEISHSNSCTSQKLNSPLIIHDYDLVKLEDNTVDSKNILGNYENEGNLIDKKIPENKKVEKIEKESACKVCSVCKIF